MKKCLLFIAWLSISLGQPALADQLTILTENLPPLNFVRDGELIGPSVEIVREIQKRVGSSADIEVYPWSRAYKRVKNEKNVVLFGMTHTEARHDKFKWVGPLAKKRDILVARKGTNIRINNLADAQKVGSIGTLRDDTREELLLSYGFTNLESVSDEQLNAKKLALGRIDLWAYKKPGLKTVCELAGVDYNEIEEVYSLREIEVSIAFSLQTADSIVNKWQTAFDELSGDGTLARIHNKWDIE